MTPVINTTVLTTGGTLVTTINDAGATLVLTGDTIAPDFSIGLSPAQSRVYATFFDSAEDSRDLENLMALQAQFETEMGAELIAYNSQALTKDPVTKVYTQAVTRIAFDSYQKGLDGPP
ncbi:hypothetical protein phiPsa267_133 [Pseudomonas phage phiPsa267]|uniref:Uncharacterized protein n=9 Tax=Otagovirus TaxID=2560197 RepID=A0A7G9V0Z0_9CAUD|nr:hypothetical protein CF96_gp092 [Pseudomonas phage phiPsa374]YP_010766863.1 hypothetical protein QGX14_gp098 [Pseudomonas phage psageK4]YP_010767054.1 hypothetical protein QGX15_gp098 [Pseudomonas phage psageK4e]YP_010767224.1 hypothetical protein QGX16_gp091 [Pseudomonas phage phiPsa397]YP_010767743.1 hypothetical protein QGX19_gp097 [Pseudomonas phage phiPsa267]YP_010767919.1 hypothetical protein QGX20_gp089 [Pseudomonas phage phiPsa300]YP_010768086.1 hypothetical protein QGX21_gp097 [Ps